ncbi:PREDICTED: uncharacterized protein LOC108557065 [Nicrophorus vespilloides]|uniref:Uncharacterized protein LOC108557065 n=1 Tax=Nicrophorus vespilloides TaxID=110193 RepID=A0ABM1M2Z1_NICVS|nr:PREDICTED: uncharacterized protein LOC108557065 [Nicrophorus vespilloides]
MYPSTFIQFEQYNNAYPNLKYEQPPSAVNGYGWHGNGYGWQVDPSQWKTASIYPTLDEGAAEEEEIEAIEEPVIEAKKVEKIESSSTYGNQSLPPKILDAHDHHALNTKYYRVCSFTLKI